MTWKREGQEVDREAVLASLAGEDVDLQEVSAEGLCSVLESRFFCLKRAVCVCMCVRASWFTRWARARTLRGLLKFLGTSQSWGLLGPFRRRFQTVVVQANARCWVCSARSHDLNHRVTPQKQHFARDAKSFCLRISSTKKVYRTRYPKIPPAPQVVAAQEEEDGGDSAESIETQGMNALAQLPHHQQVRASARADRLLA